MTFSLGWLVLVTALLPPLESLAAGSFAVHMIQHEVLMLVAAPLLVLGRPLPVFLWAFPSPVRSAVGRWTRRPPVRRSWAGLMHPFTGWSMHAAALWVWHAPSIFRAALATPALHELQHLSFVVSALLFWSGLLVAGGAAGRGGASLYLFTTTVHTSVLGALITFARTPWYTPAIRLEQSLDSMTDQQLGGLIMWVPGSLVYVGFGVLLLMRWVLDSGLSTHSVRPDRP